MTLAEGRLGGGTGALAPLPLSNDGTTLQTGLSGPITITGTVPVAVVTPVGSTDGGQNVPLGTANTVVRAAAAPCPSGMLMISADPINTAQIHIGRANTVTAGNIGRGGVLTAGQSVILPAANANEYYFVSSAINQNVHLLAL